MGAPLDGQKRPRITLGAIVSKVMTSVTRIPDLGLLVLGLILVLQSPPQKGKRTKTQSLLKIWEKRQGHN